MRAGYFNFAGETEGTEFRVQWSGEECFETLLSELSSIQGLMILPIKNKGGAEEESKEQRLSCGY